MLLSVAPGTGHTSFSFEAISLATDNFQSGSAASPVDEEGMSLGFVHDSVINRHTSYVITPSASPGDDELLLRACSPLVAGIAANADRG
jgi:hypothetical protein